MSKPSFNLPTVHGRSSVPLMGGKRPISAIAENSGGQMGSLSQGATMYSSADQQTISRDQQTISRDQQTISRDQQTALCHPSPEQQPHKHKVQPFGELPRSTSGVGAWADANATSNK